MRKSLATLATLFVGCATGVAVQGLAAQSFAPNPSAQKWEVLCVNPRFGGTGRDTVDQQMTQHLHEVGMSGWEPYSMFGTTQSARACFKRPAP
jgi:hypothetical protein